MKTRILVLGAVSTAGRCVSTALTADPAIECMIGVNRHDEGRAFAKKIGVGSVTMDMDDDASVRKALDGVFAVVNAEGPFQRGNYRAASQCVSRGVHYIDMAGSREYVTGITALNRKAEANACLIVAGATSTPAISGALVDALAPEFDRVTEIHTAIMPEEKLEPWRSTLGAMLTCVGEPMRIKQRGHWRPAFSWSEPATVAFPTPVGRRRVYLCDVADLELFPNRYGAQTVTSRIGLRQVCLSHTLAGLGRLRRGHKQGNAEVGTKSSTRDGGGFQRLVDATAGIRVQLHGPRDGVDVLRAVCLIARRSSPAMIASSPAIALIKKWVRGGVADTGAMPCLGLLGLAEIKAELLGHDIVLVRS